MGAYVLLSLEAPSDLHFAWDSYHLSRICYWLNLCPWQFMALCEREALWLLDVNIDHWIGTKDSRSTMMASILFIGEGDYDLGLG